MPCLFEMGGKFVISVEPPFCNKLCDSMNVSIKLTKVNIFLCCLILTVARHNHCTYIIIIIIILQGIGHSRPVPVQNFNF
jgi:hypothetical protein